MPPPLVRPGPVEEEGREVEKPLTAVLGCGPSGLLAAHTLDSYGVPFAILSKKAKSTLGGAQFSHIPIPGLTEEADTSIRYRVRGDAAGYAAKVYPGMEVPFVSFENVKDGLEVPAWNLRKMYDRLWEMYEAKIIDLTFNAKEAEVFAGGFGAVFSSIPLPTLCSSGSHWFRSQTVRIADEAWSEDLEDNTIIYDGSPEVSWYRASSLWGVRSTEWGAAAGVPSVKTHLVSKPVATNCDCLPSIIRIGRYGTWTKGMLTFHAYDVVRSYLAHWGFEI